MGSFDEETTPGIATGSVYPARRMRQRAVSDIA
jgi:hypothetical protein